MLGPNPCAPASENPREAVPPQGSFWLTEADRDCALEGSASFASTQLTVPARGDRSGHQLRRSTSRLSSWMSSDSELVRKFWLFASESRSASTRLISTLRVP